MSNQVREVRSFEIGEDEEFAIVAGSVFGEQRSIYADPEPGRYAIVPIDDLNDDRRIDYDAEELRYGDAEAVGAVRIDPDSDDPVTIMHGETVETQRSTPGQYLTLRIPFQPD